MKRIIIAICLTIALSGCQETPTGNTVATSTEKIIEIGMNSQGYTPNPILLKIGEPVILKSDGTISGCGAYMISKELGLKANLANENEYSFTPTKKGKFDVSCTMNMHKGKIKVE